MKPRPQQSNQMVQMVRHIVELRRFLVPNAVINNLLGYCLALALEDTQVDLNVGQFTLDRTELTLFDRERERSDVARVLFSNIARAINVLTDRTGSSLWGPRDRDGATPLLDREAVLEAMAETISAPVEQGLVDRHQDWLGLSYGPEDWGKTFVYKRPDFYFSDEMPETLTVTPVPPPGFEEEGERALRERLRRMVNLLEEAARKAREARDEKALGPKALRRMERGEFAKRPPKRADRRHFRTTCPERAVRAGQALREFLRRHAEARREMLRRRRERDFLFPPETYWWRRHSDVPCEPLRDRQVYDEP